MNSVMQSDDALTEYLIDHSYRLMMAATDDAGRRHWCNRLKHYVSRRSPERVREMERDKGLA